MTYCKFGGPDAWDKGDGEAELPNSCCATFAPLTPATDDTCFEPALDQFQLAAAP